MDRSEDSSRKPPSAKKETARKPKKGLKSVDLETAKILSNLREKANKKNFGRPVKESEILAIAVRLVTPDHLKELQSMTMRDKDRVRLAFENYQRDHGKLSMDRYLGLLVNGEIKPTKSVALTFGHLPDETAGA